LSQNQLLETPTEQNGAEKVGPSISLSPMGNTHTATAADRRRASMVWVDYLSEEGVQPDSDLEREIEFAHEDFRNRIDYISKGRRASELSRKIWFGRATETDDKLIDESESREKEDENDDSISISNGSGLEDRDRDRERAGSTTPQIPFSHPDPTQHKNVDEIIFDIYKDKNEEVVPIGNFLASLEQAGLRRNDPRLRELMANLKEAKDVLHRSNQQIKRGSPAAAADYSLPGYSSGSIEALRLNREDFKTAITENIVLISKALRQQFVIPDFSAFCAHIERIYNDCKNVNGGNVATYIPQLARVDPKLWGVAICTVDGQRFSIGDTLIPFTIQSCSKPLTYAMALNELGQDTVHKHVGQEPSGRMFNELVLDHNMKPHNPMVNAGAIVVSSLLKTLIKPELSLAEKFDYTQEYFKKLCGGEYVGFNNAVFLSERESADRNYALGYYMKENKCFPEGINLKECVDYYLQICSMECNCEAMSVMASTLANGGICPISGELVLKSDSVRDVLSLMHSCGMYDYSGQFAFKVGLPAKSGVCGAIMIVIPNVLGITVWSPPLDFMGNSVKGVEFCKEFVEIFNFHKYDDLGHVKTSPKLDPRRHRHETKGLNIVNLLFSAASGDVTSILRYHLSGMDMNASDYDGRTALHLAAAEGHLECVVFLLKRCRVKHNPTDRWGHLPEDDAVRFGHDDVLEFLRSWIPIGE
jgi:glutaminase